MLIFRDRVVFTGVITGNYVLITGNNVITLRYKYAYTYEYE